MPQRAPVLCLGEALIDLIGEPAAAIASTEHFTPRVGGAPANVAVGLTRLGVSASFVGALSDDPLASMIEARLATEGVDTRWFLPVSGYQTRLAVVTGPPDERDFTFYGEPPADSALTAERAVAAVEAGASALYLSSLPLAKEPSRSALAAAVAAAKQRGIPVCFDPNPRWQIRNRAEHLVPAILDLAMQADFLKLSTTDLTVLRLRREDVSKLGSQARVVVLTDGPRGCDYWIGGSARHQEAFQVAAIDGTGAGDAFTAAMIARGVENGFSFGPPDVTFASAACALATTRVGAIEALPTRGEVERLLSVNE